jgi:hypothetical protein
MCCYVNFKKVKSLIVRKDVNNQFLVYDIIITGIAFPRPYNRGIVVIPQTENDGMEAFIPAGGESSLSTLKFSSQLTDPLGISPLSSSSTVCNIGTVLKNQM